MNLATQPPQPYNSPPAPDRACLAPGLIVVRRTIQHALRSPNHPTDAFEPQRRSDTPLVFVFTGQHLPRTAGTYTALHRSTLACTSAEHVERSSNLVFALTIIACLYSPRYRAPEAFVYSLRHSSCMHAGAMQRGYPATQLLCHTFPGEQSACLLCATPPLNLLITVTQRLGKRKPPNMAVRLPDACNAFAYASAASCNTPTMGAPASAP